MPKLAWEEYNPNRPGLKIAEPAPGAKLILVYIPDYDEWELEIQMRFSCWDARKTFTLDIETTDWDAAQAKAELAAAAYFNEIKTLTDEAVKAFE